MIESVKWTKPIQSRDDMLKAVIETELSTKLEVNMQKVSHSTYTGNEYVINGYLTTNGMDFQASVNLIITSDNENTDDFILQEAPHIILDRFEALSAQTGDKWLVYFINEVRDTLPKRISLYKPLMDVVEKIII